MVRIPQPRSRRRRTRPTRTGPSLFEPLLAGEGEVWFDGGLVLDNPTYVVGRHEWKGDSRVVFAFDLTPRRGAAVARAELRLPVHDVAPGVFAAVQLFVDHIDGDGIIDASDYAGNTLRAGTEPVRAGPELAVDVTRLVNDDLSAGRSASMFRLRIEVLTRDAGMWTLTMGASTHEHPVKRPMLHYVA